jgi:hypothetical protein
MPLWPGYLFLNLIQTAASLSTELQAQARTNKGSTLVHGNQIRRYSILKYSKYKKSSEVACGKLRV